MNLQDYIAAIPDFPTKGILFRDITPLIQDPEAYKYVIEKLADYCKSKGADIVVSPDARGFLFGCPVAYAINKGFVPVRKPGKLPRETINCKYDLEYGSNELHIHKDAIIKGQKVVIIDDLLATGGTVEATIKMVEELGGEVVGTCYVIELVDLKGKEVLGGHDVYSLIKY